MSRIIDAMIGSFRLRLRSRRAILPLLSVPILWLAVTMIAGARDAKPSTAYASCMSKATSTLEMQSCQKAAVASVDARLAKAVAKALVALPVDQQAKLKRAQQRWVAFRSSDCQVFFGRDSGTIATVQSGDCMIDRAEERIANLRSFGAK